jgi:hypothetical protein
VEDAALASGLLRVTETGFQNIAVEWLDEALHPIEEAVLVELARNLGIDPNRRAVIVDTIDEDLDLKAVINERDATRAHIVRVEEQDFSFHSLQHGFGLLDEKTAPVIANGVRYAGLECRPVVPMGAAGRHVESFHCNPFS